MAADNAVLLLGDCLEQMDAIPDGSIDLILADLPYGTTACKWDTVLDLAVLWAQYERVIKPNGAIVLFGSQPFTSVLITSNLKRFKYEWVWDKAKPSSGLLAKRQPLKSHENILVFYKEQPTYNPQMYEGTQWHRGGNRRTSAHIGGTEVFAKAYKDETNLKYPKTILPFSNANNTKRVHPAEKPVALLEYLIKTYTNEGETVLDNTMGSGSTGVAALNTGRKFIGIEKELQYFEVAEKRVFNSFPPVVKQVHVPGES